MADGAPPTWIVASRTPVRALIRESVESELLATQRDPSLSFRAAGPLPTRVSNNARPLRGSTLAISAWSKSATQMPSAPATTAVGRRSSVNVSVTSPERASSTTSAWSIVSAIQSLPAWNVIAAVLAPPRWMVCVTRSVPGSILVIAPPSVLATQIAPPP